MPKRRKSKPRLIVSRHSEQDVFRRHLMAWFRMEDEYQNGIIPRLATLARNIDGCAEIDATTIARLLAAYHSAKTRIDAAPLSRILDLVGANSHYGRFVQEMKSAQEQENEIWEPSEESTQETHRTGIVEALLGLRLLDESGIERISGAKAVIRLLAQRPTRRYMSALIRAVSELRLYHDGRPADWAAGFVHADVMRELGHECENAPPGGAIIMRQFFMMLIAGPDQGTIGRTLLTSTGLRASDEPVSVSVDSSPNPLQSHDYLDQLEKEAIAQVKKLFAEVHEQLQPARRKRNPGFHAGRKEDIEVLYKFLRADRYEEYPSRSHLKDVADDVGIDLPSYESLFGKNKYRAF